MCLWGEKKNPNHSRQSFNIQILHSIFCQFQNTDPGMFHLLLYLGSEKMTASYLEVPPRGQACAFAKNVSSTLWHYLLYIATAEMLMLQVNPLTRLTGLIGMDAVFPDEHKGHQLECLG